MEHGFRHHLSIVRRKAKKVSILIVAAATMTPAAAHNHDIVFGGTHGWTAFSSN